MKILKSIFSLSKFEVFLLTFSIFVVTVSSILAKSNALNTTASIIGVTALIYIAKGLPLGQILSIIFCILYALCSYTFKYYGELATYLFMSLPASIISLVVWLKNPFQEDKTEIKIEKLSKYKIVISIILSLTITILFYYILKA